MRIVSKKVELAKKKLQIKHPKGTREYSKKAQVIDRFAAANIPVAYWTLKMRDFEGPVNIRDATINYIKDLDDNYAAGKGLCYLGNFGLGKTMSACAVLKSALMTGYNAYYTTLTDLISYMSDFDCRREFNYLVTRSDFLCIDEVDSRYFSDSKEAQRMFGSNFERVIRYRNQNQLPTIIASNNATITEVFTGQYKRAVDSLLATAQIVSALGKDFRKHD